MLNKSFITRLIWFLLVILALAGSANFARKIFTSWQVVFVLGLLLLLLSQLTTLFLAALSVWPSRPNPNLAKLMGRKHDLTNKKTTTKTNTKTMTMAMTNIFRAFKERSLRLLTFETFDHLDNTFKERYLRLLTFQTFDQSDEKT